ncbi:prolyl-tRNA synthetase associated domain-containing protein [Pleionea mediterranea]|uniref:Ala-tRNA(Pro) hydrolase n=1 Tax=Pleionea mediterranea TaxID=523701 RepID=A0A316G055_9GAMM|nr:prolyl-tRNA synthetase associated domain-containing protein [Pleionea mediterranea]PWK54281.1 Ala-tRNA(Pro) hydrolase [Pleionea mediterranea]
MHVEQLTSLLKAWGVDYKRYQHPPLDTCDEADALQLQRSGTRLKNLFLKDNYGRRHFLLLTTPEKRVDLKLLSKQMSIARLGFASERRLLKYLKVKPGCVSLLALINDEQQQVELLLDNDIVDSEYFQCHPLINTETYVLSHHNIDKFLANTGHTVKSVLVPEINESKG